MHITDARPASTDQDELEQLKREIELLDCVMGSCDKILYFLAHPPADPQPSSWLYILDGARRSIDAVKQHRAEVICARTGLEIATEETAVSPSDDI